MYRLVVAKELVAISKTLVGTTIREKLKQYPVRSRVWRLTREHGRDVFVAEASDFGSSVIVDPWGRKIDMRHMKEDIAAEDEIVGWSGRTTVDGIPVDLYIIND